MMPKSGGTMIRPSRISLRWEPDEDGTLSLAAFLGLLTPLRGALFYTARDPDASAADLKVRVKIVDLKHAKNAFSVVATAAVQNGHAQPFLVGKELVSNLGSFRSARIDKGPPIRDMDVLEAYQRLVEPVQKRMTRQVTIASGGQRVAINRKYVDRLVRVIGPDRQERGRISGRLLKVSLYRKHRFDIFPSVGPRRIACSFVREALPLVGKSLGEYVTVEGTLKFKHWDRLPYAVDNITNIEPHEQAGLPTLADLRGMLPSSVLGSMTSEEFVDSAREKDW